MIDRTKNYLYWSLYDDDGVVQLCMDCPQASSNTLSRAALSELDEIIQQLKNSAAKALVISSAKKNGFIAGADIHDFTDIADQHQAFQYMRDAQRIFDDLESLPYPCIALIDGYCLGGGLELALACNIRIATDETHTKLGFPEVRLGIHPGFGGTARATALLGGLTALPMIISGRNLNARRARKIGLLDFLVPARHLQRTATLLIQGSLRVPKAPAWRSWSNMALIRPLIAVVIRRKTKQHLRPEHYPAPFRMLELWQSYASDRNKMMEEEARSVAKLITGSTAKHLIHAFFLQDRLKALGKQQPADISKVHVIGAGVMGGDIAAWCAMKGLQVSLQDQSPQHIAPAIGRAHRLFQRRLKTTPAIQAAMDRLMPDVDGVGLQHADLIIEVIFEDLQAKQSLFQKIEAEAQPNALFASNTSSIPLQEIATALTQPERLIGLHFFNPVAKMPLIEVVASEASSQFAIKRGLAFAHLIGKLPLPVASKPGFLVNRILMPYLMQAMLILQQGVEASTIDDCATTWGMPMGPLALADQVGLDVCLHVAEVLAEHFHGEIPAILKQQVAEGRLGKKTGQGFYAYPQPYRWPWQSISNRSSLSISKEDIQDRLILSMLNESVACLHDGVVTEAEFCDAGMIFATGFAPFRGGPMEVIRSRGIDEILLRLSQLERYGPAFKAHQGWQQLHERFSTATSSISRADHATN